MVHHSGSPATIRTYAFMPPCRFPQLWPLMVTWSQGVSTELRLQAFKTQLEQNRIGIDIGPFVLMPKTMAKIIGNLALNVFLITNFFAITVVPVTLNISIH